MESRGEVVSNSQKDAVSEAEIAAARLVYGMEALLERMIEQQRAKVLRLATEAVPHLSPEDVLNPFDFPELKAHPTFDYEDGILAGLISAQIALRAELRSPERAPPGGG
jgi:hypothetical protein